jgi:hypothetical protein
MNAQNEKVKFEANIPVEVRLACEEGKKVEGKYGESMMYTLRDGRVMFVPLAASERIAALHPGPDEPFMVCKKQNGSNGRKNVEWMVYQVEGSAGKRSVPEGVSRIQRKLEAAGLKLRTFGRLANETGYQLHFTTGEIVNVFDTGTVNVQGKNGAQVDQILAGERGSGTSLDKLAERLSLNGAKEVALPLTGQAAPQENNAARNQSTFFEKMNLVMQLALQGAFEATVAAERYARETGWCDLNGDPFRFSRSDIRAIGLTLFIEARRKTVGW